MEEVCYATGINMDRSFESLLNEIFDSGRRPISEQVPKNAYLRKNIEDEEERAYAYKFFFLLDAIAANVDMSKAINAIRKLADSDADSIKAIMNQVNTSAVTMNAALQNLVKSQPNIVTTIQKIVDRLFTGRALLVVSKVLADKCTIVTADDNIQPFTCSDCSMSGTPESFGTTEDYMNAVNGEGKYSAGDGNTFVRCPHPNCDAVFDGESSWLFIDEYVDSASTLPEYDTAGDYYSQGNDEGGH